MLNKFGITVSWIFRLLPAAVLFSLAFALDGGLRWLGLFGIAALFIGLNKDCPLCGPQPRTCEAEKNTFHSWPGH